MMWKFWAAVVAALVWSVCVGAALADKAAPDVTLTGHTATVSDLVFSADSRRLASVGEDGVMRIWDLEARKELGNCPGLRTTGNRVRFTPDGKKAIALGSESNVVVFDVEAGKAKPLIVLSDVPGDPSALDLSPDGKTLAMVGRGWLRLFEASTGNPRGTYEVHKGYDVPAVAFSADGAMLATASTDNSATVFKGTSGRIVQTFKLPLNGVAVAFSRDGKALYVACTDQTVRSFDIGTANSRTLVDKSLPILSLMAGKDGKVLVAGGPAHGPWLVALPEGTLLEPAYDSDAWVKCAAISPDCRWLAGGANGGDVYLWKMAR